MLSVYAQPGILSLANGLPAAELISVHEYAAALDKVLSSDARALQYGPPYEPLKEQIVDPMAERGVRCAPEQILVTTGAQQGIDIVTKLLLEPDRQVLTEEVTYPGVTQAVAPFRLELVTVGSDLKSGMDVDAVEDALVGGAQPAFIYAIADAHNPQGVSLSPAKRCQLVELARRFHIPIVEDDAYSQLSCGPAFHPPLRSLEEEWVIYLGTFSKTIAPALRLGWMVLPAKLLPSATIAKEVEDLESSALTQRAVSLYLADGGFSAHLAALRRVYHTRRDALLEALEQHFPSTARWSRPVGGFFVWVELPRAVDCAALLVEALQAERVAFIPGHVFSVSGRAASNCMRLSFATCTPEEIEEGVRRLARLLTRRIPHARFLSHQANRPS